MYHRSFSRQRETGRWRRRGWATPVAVLTVGTLALSLVACGGSGRQGGSPTDASGTRPVSNAAPAAPSNQKSERVTVGAAVPMAALQARDVSTSSAGAWRLVTKPPNSQAVLGAAPDKFKPDVPGQYVLRLGDGTSSADNLVLNATPSQELVCVNTRAWTGADSSTAHIRIGTTDYPRSGPGLQVVVLSRANLGEIHGVQPNQTFAPTADGYAHYAAFLKGLSSSDLVFINGAVNSNDLPSVWGPLAGLGAADLPAPFPQQDIPFSFIGIPGLGRGQGWQAVDGNPTRSVRSSCDSNPGAGPDAGLSYDPTNNLAGWLTLDSTGTNYTYVARDYVTVDTDVKTGPAEHEIQVGNQTYTAPPFPESIDPYTRAWHVLVMERDSLCPDDADPAVCQQPDPVLNQGYAEGQFAAMADALQRYKDNPDDLLIVAPYGSKPASPVVPRPVVPWSLVDVLRQFGTSPLAPGRAFDDAASKYAFIGGGDSMHLPAGSAPPTTAESFTGFSDSEDGHITGYLTRDNQNRFGPSEVTTGGVPVQGLSALAYGPTTDWPSDTNSDAYRFLSGQAGYPVGDAFPIGIRGEYDVPPGHNSFTAVHDWTWAEVVAHGLQKEAGGNEATYNQVRRELYAEIQEAENVDTWTSRLDTVFNGNGNDIQPLIKNVTDEITKSYPPPTQKSSLTLELIHTVLGFAKAIPEVGEVFGLAGEVMDAALSVSRDAAGEPEDYRGKIFDTGQEMLSNALKFLSDSQATLHHLQSVVTSDPHKLEIVGKKTDAVTGLVSTDGSGGYPWQISDGDQRNQLNKALTDALMRWLVPDLVGNYFKIWQVDIPSEYNFNDANRTPLTYRCDDGYNYSHPFGPNAGFTDDMWMKLSNGSNDFYLVLNGIKYDRVDIESNGHHGTPPTQNLMNLLFGTAPGDLGLDKTWFFEHGFAESLLVPYPKYLDIRAYQVDCESNH